jgi:hypothetical protein
MSDDHIQKEGQHLRQELDEERPTVGGTHRRRCSADLRARVVAYGTAAVVELALQTGGSVLAKVEGHRGAIVIGYGLRMVEASDGWKVGEP